MYKVLVVTRTFGKYSNEPIELLKNNGFEIVRSNYIDINSLKNFDALIVGTSKVTYDMLENSSIKIIGFMHFVSIRMSTILPQVEPTYV